VRAAFWGDDNGLKRGGGRRWGGRRGREEGRSDRGRGREGQGIASYKLNFKNVDDTP